MKVSAPVFVGYMKTRVPPAGDSSTSLSTRSEGPLGLNRFLNSFDEDGGMYRSTTARLTVDGGTTGRGDRGRVDRSSW